MAGPAAQALQSGRAGAYITVMLRRTIRWGACSGEPTMLISLLISLVAPRKRFTWQPAIEIRDGAMAAALGIYSRG